jgi:hypothetical protein
MYDNIRRQATQSKDDVVVLKVKITNTADTAVRYYIPWGGKDFAAASELARLRDEFGNSYANFRPAFGLVFSDQLTARTRVDPGMSVTDIVVFDPPFAKAQEFRISLPCRNLGVTAQDIEYKLPRTFFD